MDNGTTGACTILGQERGIYLYTSVYILYFCTYTIFDDNHVLCVTSKASMNGDSLSLRLYFSFFLYFFYYLFYYTSFLTAHITHWRVPQYNGPNRHGQIKGISRPPYSSSFVFIVKQQQQQLLLCVGSVSPYCEEPKSRIIRGKKEKKKSEKIYIRGIEKTRIQSTASRKSI